jgi:hypothetical protein
MICGTIKYRRVSVEHSRWKRGLNYIWIANFLGHTLVLPVFLIFYLFWKESNSQWVLTNSVAQEPEGSSSHSQQLTTGPYPEPVESNPHPQPISPRYPFWSHHPTYALVFRVISFLQAFPTKPLHFSLLPHACHLPCLPHSPWLDLLNDIWGWVQIMNLLIVQLPSESYTLFIQAYTRICNLCDQRRMAENAS